MNYRKEIDGLRAVAVLPVILFHAGFQSFSGGFVGVDIFFVISGYLITSLLIEEIERGEFSVARFYERRARRILPALFVVLICCIPMAWLLLLPRQLEDFSASLVTTLLSLSNLFFMSKVDYFASKAELYPLLHTWSLAVEEQYYLLFPLLLLALRKSSRRKAIFVVGGLVALSFLYSEVARQYEPGRNFFFTLSRFWEIGIGSLCAYYARANGQGKSDALSLLGAALILYAIFAFDAGTVFPSPATLIPVAGAALVIQFVGPGTLVNRTLSLRPLVGIGLISYSAYLWHQPLFAFARSASLTDPGLPLMTGLACLSLVLGWASWAFIEQPFRRRQNPLLASQRQVFGASLLMGTVLIAIGLVGYVQRGAPERFGAHADISQLEARIAINYGLSRKCEGGDPAVPDCATSPEPHVLLWGDSFAMHLVQGLVASQPDLALRQHTMSACAPVLGVSAMPAAFGETWASECNAHNDQALTLLRQTKGYDLVILSSALGAVLEGDLLSSEGEVIAAPPVFVVREKLLETAREIRATGANVVLVSPTPPSGWDTGLCAIRSIFFGYTEDSCDFALDTGTKVYDFVGSLEKELPVYRIESDICPNGRCDAIRDDVIIYRDGGHLSKEGSAYLGAANDWMGRLRALAVQGASP